MARLRAPAIAGESLSQGRGREEPWGESSHSCQGRRVVLVCHSVVLGKGEAGRACH